ncbi:hypothetical protein V502_03223 [Pseudogymnoascus sp. VKM F-4520 (FW-2644)]|nr:hypothetical protein V502_03223 [Pseudogymnoascus sp. VKM F-4520 (FW-2644)]
MSIAAFFTSLAALAAACGLPAHMERQVPPKSAITNVHVFDGTKFGQPTTVVMVGGIITNANAFGATVVNGNRGYLIPGLIDAHCHITSCSYLTTMRQYGVTTALDMGSFPYSAVSACKASGVTDILGSGAAGTVNGTSISHIPGFPSDSFIPDPASAQKFVADRVAEGADYIKVFLDPLGPDEATLAAVTKAAHQAGKIVIAHAPSYADYSEAQQAGVDIPTHAPLDRPLDGPSIANLTRGHRHIVPTLIMMQSIVNNTHAPYTAYSVAAQGSVSAMYKAGVPIVVGTDANSSPFVPANPPFGESIHDELALFVAAGISNVDALRGATSLAAEAFRLYDRGSIKAGLRADLVLLQHDPTVDISNARTIQKVWVAGVETDVAI